MFKRAVESASAGRNVARSSRKGRKGFNLMLCKPLDVSAGAYAVLTRSERQNAPTLIPCAPLRIPALDDDGGLALNFARFRWPSLL
jgi:hypothetical protein